MRLGKVIFITLIIFGCSVRDYKGVDQMPLCSISENKDNFSIICKMNRLSISKDLSFIIFSDSNRDVWKFGGNDPYSEFSTISFKNKEGYTSPDRLSLFYKTDNRYEFVLYDKEEKILGKFIVRINDDIFFLNITNESGEANRFGFTLNLIDGVFHYGMGELTDENDIWRKLYHPTEQHFVLDNGSFERPYLQTDEGTDVISPLIFNSRGGCLFVDSYSYLDLSFNRDKNRLFKIHIVPEFGERDFEIAIFSAPNTRNAFEKWVSSRWRNRPDLPLNFRPSDDLIKKPIWTTWALYKWSVDQNKVKEFADNIMGNDLPISFLEIDDRWTTKYGDLDFDPDKFPDPESLINYLHNSGIKVSLWVPPFVNQDAESFEDGIKRKAFIAAYNSRYPALVGWWNSGNLPNAGLIDVFSENGREWFGSKIDYLIEKYGIDGFKYDAGESQFLPLKPRLPDGIYPNMYSDYYARWGLLNKGVEMRSGYFSQNLPILFRQFDKASHWGFNNGLASVMTQILSMGIIGYPYVLPDMIGGNEYLSKASEELFIRWVELNTYMPYMQFSIPPFRDSYSEDVLKITKKYLKMREKIIPYIIEGAKESSLTQMPINRPLFFEFPDDQVAYQIEDQFMLYNKYLVAPVIVEGIRERKIYFPSGKFRSIHNPLEIINGPIYIEKYPAPLDIIPVFERIE